MIFRSPFYWPRVVGLALLGLGLGLILNSCTQTSTPGRRSEAILATDSPWVPAAVQAYNKTNPDIPLRVHFTSTLRQDLDDGALLIDGVVSQNLHYPQARDLFADLTGVLSDFGTTAQYFPRGSISYSNSDEYPIALPLAYDLPVIVFSRTPATSPLPLEGESLFQAWSLEVDEFRRRSQEFTARTGDRVTRLGYYPGWDREFLLGFSRLAGAEIVADPSRESRLAWNSQGLDQALEIFRTWQGDQGPNPTEVEVFTQRFAYAPWYRQILDNRVAFRVVLLTEFLSLPSEYRSRLQFRWIVAEGQVPVAENPVYFSISRNASSTLGVVHFVRWLLSPEGITQTLQTWIDNGQIGIRFLGGIPVDLRDPVLPREEKSWEKVYYQAINLPPITQLSFPPSVPAQWETITREVILPWMREEIRNPQAPGSSESRLTVALEGWQRLYRQE